MYDSSLITQLNKVSWAIKYKHSHREEYDVCLEALADIF